MSFRASSAFASALINGDYSSLSDDESAQLDSYISSLCAGPVVGCREYGFAKCDVTRLWGDCCVYTTQLDVDALCQATAEYLENNKRVPREAIAEYLTLFSPNGVDFDKSDFEDKYAGTFETESEFWDTVIEQWHELYIDQLPISASERNYLSGYIDREQLIYDLKAEGEYTVSDTPAGFIAFRNY